MSGEQDKNPDACPKRIDSSTRYVIALRQVFTIILVIIFFIFCTTLQTIAEEYPGLLLFWSQYH